VTEICGQSERQEAVHTSYSLADLVCVETVGIGCTQQYADNWIAHQEDFNSILSTLNKDVTIQPSIEAFSLHDKSKNSKSRVQYASYS